MSTRYVYLHFFFCCYRFLQISLFLSLSLSHSLSLRNVSHLNSQGPPIKKRKPGVKYPPHVSKTRNRFQVRRSHNGTQYTFGTYGTMEEAEEVSLAITSKLNEGRKFLDLYNEYKVRLSSLFFLLSHSFSLTSSPLPIISKGKEKKRTRASAQRACKSESISSVDAW